MRSDQFTRPLFRIGTYKMKTDTWIFIASWCRYGYFDEYRYEKLYSKDTPMHLCRRDFIHVVRQVQDKQAKGVLR